MSVVLVCVGAARRVLERGGAGTLAGVAAPAQHLHSCDQRAWDDVVAGEVGGWVGGALPPWAPVPVGCPVRLDCRPGDGRPTAAVVRSSCVSSSVADAVVGCLVGGAPGFPWAGEVGAPRFEAGPPHVAPFVCGPISLLAGGVVVGRVRKRVAQMTVMPAAPRVMSAGVRSGSGSSVSTPVMAAA